MALTAEGKALTEAHRVGQIAIGARAEASARLLWPLLDPADLDRYEPAWMGATLSVMRPHYEESVALAGAYVREYRRAEGANAAPLGTAPWDRQYMAGSLHMAGPVRVKLLVKGGMTGTAAAGAALIKFGGIARRGVMSGGRMMVNESYKRDGSAIGWRRVADGDPCTFCAMLATRGPVYGKDTVLTTGEGLRYHGHCGCTAELVYGSWQPTEMEKFFIEEYERAATEADALGLPRTQRNVLPRMRRNGIFKDSPLTRNKASGS